MTKTVAQAQAALDRAIARQAKADAHHKAFAGTLVGGPIAARAAARAARSVKRAKAVLARAQANG